MHQLITKNLDKIKTLCRINPVKKLYLFGSFATGYGTEKSDVDLLIEFDNAKIADKFMVYITLLMNFEDILDRNVDLVEEHLIEKQYILDDINRSKILIYG